MLKSLRKKFVIGFAKIYSRHIQIAQVIRPMMRVTFMASRILLWLPEA